MTTLDAAVAAHTQWKAEFELAILGGGHGLELPLVGRDDRCALGRWLHARGPEAFRELGTLGAAHRRFHREAAAVLRMAQEGRVADAVRAMELTEPYGRWSAALLAALQLYLGNERDEFPPGR